MVYSFIPRESSKTRSIGFAEEVAPTLNADNNCAVTEPICFTHDTWMKINNEGVAYTVLERDNKNPQCVVIEDAESNRNA